MAQREEGQAVNPPQPEQPDLTYEEAHAILKGLAEAAAPRHPDRDGAAAPGNGDGLLPKPAPGVIPTLTEQTLRALLEGLPDALVVIDRSGTIVVVNALTEQMFGYARHELLGHPVELLVPERFRQAHVGHRAGFFAAPHSRAMGVGLSLWGRRKDGSEFPVEISLSPLQTEHGLLVTSAIRDISARKREEAKFRTLVENIPAVTFIAPLDRSTPEFYVSPQIEQLLGFSQKEWTGNPVLWYQQLHPDDRERWNGQFAPTCSEGAAFDSVYRFLAKDGRVVWVHGSARLVRDPDGRPLFLQGVAFDVTPIKEAESALQRLNEELDQRVQERTQELARSMSELREKSEELEQFAHVASHDLREPLRTLVNWPQRLARQYAGQFDEQAMDCLNRIINGAERMRRLIDGLSHYARVLRRDRVFAVVDCASAVGEAVAALQASLDDSRAALLVGELPVVKGNQQQLMLVFMNLIGNAVKFRAADRAPRVEVASRRDGDGWLLWVRDNGIGIEPKYHKRVFGLGERLHPPSRYAGTGFGLAICEKIVAGHGGRIWTVSEPGVGSTFYFTLPDSGLAPEPASPPAELAPDSP
ncbi:MAG: PAS domain S-box protein [Gemmataceae bacterium]|nr:PAS domain S-box protein [Gemmataceae bacterium]